MGGGRGHIFRDGGGDGSKNVVPVSLSSVKTSRRIVKIHCVAAPLSRYICYSAGWVQSRVAARPDVRDIMGEAGHDVI